MIEYIIVGDTKKYDACLVKICRGMKLANAEKELLKMLNDPDENDLMLMKGHENLRLVAVPEDEQWWNDPFLMSD